MKKVLFGTTALVAAAFAGSAMANDLTLSIGGNFEAGVGVGAFTEENTSVSKDFHIISDGEIRFAASGTLDNGLTITVVVEMLDETGGVDEYNLTVASSLGSIEIGAEDTAEDRYAGIGNLGAGTGASIDGGNDFVPANTLSIASNDDIGIRYYSPVIAGFEFAVSWQPDEDSEGRDTDTDGGASNSNDILSFGAAYNNTFGDVDFSIGGGYTAFSADPATVNGVAGVELDSWGWGIGAELGFGGFTIGGRYETGADEEANGAGGLGEQEFTTYGAGIAYATGPWEFGVNAAMTDSDDGLTAPNGAGDFDVFKVTAGVSYELGDGVTLSGHVDYADIDFDNPTSSSCFSGATLGGNGNEGRAVTGDCSGFGGALLLGVSF